MRPIAQEVLLQQKIRGLDMKKPKTCDFIKKLGFDTNISEFQTNIRDLKKKTFVDFPRTQIYSLILEKQ